MKKGIIFLLVLSFTSCVSKKQFFNFQQEYNQLKTQVENQETEINNLENRVTELELKTYEDRERLAGVDESLQSFEEQFLMMETEVLRINDVIIGLSQRLSYSSGTSSGYTPKKQIDKGKKDAY